VAEIGGGSHLIPVEKLVLVDAAGLKQDTPIPDLNPSSLAAMRGVMEAVFYDTSWVNEEALRKIFTDKLAVHDGYTVRSFLGNPTREKERLDDRLASIKVPTLVTWGNRTNCCRLHPANATPRVSQEPSSSALTSADMCRRLKKRKSFWQR